MKEIANSVFFSYVAEEITEGKSVILRVKGKSMVPFLHEGDIITLIPCDKNSLQVGDIVLFRYRKNYFLHRIIKKNKEKLILQGDAIIRVKEKTTTKRVIALLQQVERKNGKIINCRSLAWKLRFYVWFFVKAIRSGVLMSTKKQ